MRRSILLAAASFAFLGANLVAQTATSATSSSMAKPNFAGKWTLIADASTPASGGRGGGMMAGLGANEATITQDEKAVTITRTTQMGELKSVYNLDGSESNNSLAFNGNSIPLTAKAKWDGAKFMTTTTAAFNGQSIDILMNMSIDATGTLVIESIPPSMTGGDPMPVTMKYKKG